MADQRNRMSRAARTARGALAATVTTFFAAASHSIGGGELTALAVIATAILALPLCVALAGRVGSLWRLTLAVASSQFVYHWCFAGLGFSSSADERNAALGPHAAHLGLLPLSPTAPTLTEASAGVLMWVSHAIAAALTVAALHRGERAWLEIGRVLIRVLLPLWPRLLHLTPVSGHVRPQTHSPGLLAERLFCSAAITHRGPPVTA